MKIIITRARKPNYFKVVMGQYADVLDVSCDIDVSILYCKFQHRNFRYIHIETSLRKIERLLLKSEENGHREL